jgi:hypothetical protein
VDLLVAKASLLESLKLVRALSSWTSEHSIPNDSRLAQLQMMIGAPLLVLAMLHLIGQYHNVNHRVPSMARFNQAMDQAASQNSTLPTCVVDMMHPHHSKSCERSPLADCGATHCRGDHFAGTLNVGSSSIPCSDICGKVQRSA